MAARSGTPARGAPAAKRAAAPKRSPLRRALKHRVGQPSRLPPDLAAGARDHTHSTGLARPQGRITMTRGPAGPGNPAVAPIAVRAWPRRPQAAAGHVLVDPGGGHSIASRLGGAPGVL